MIGTRTRGNRVLNDAALDRRLHRDGFVTFPFLAGSDARRLRDRFGRLRGWSGSGFASDLEVADQGYRNEVDGVIASALDGPVTLLFTDHEPFLRNFLCKYPDPDSDLYLHRDWMYVDERQGNRTHAAWIALEDIDGDNGQLRVVRGSHRIDPMLRGTDLIAPWLRYEDVLRNRLLSIPVKAGDCVVFDNALVHCSYPNHSDTPRVVAAVGMRPAGLPLVHFRRSDDSSAVRYDVDESFFLNQTPRGLIESPPDLTVAESVHVHEVDLDATQLAHALDRGLQARADRFRYRVAKVGAGIEQTRRAIEEGLEPARAAPGKVRSRLSTASTRDLRRRLRTSVGELPSKAAIVVLGSNEWTIDRFGPRTPAVWDTSEFAWTSTVEAGYAEVRKEVEALLAGATEIPHIEDVTGGIPQGNIGPWRSFVLMHQGRWIDWNCERCPRTVELLRRIPGLTMAGFSLLEPGALITRHRGPNKGALRYQMGIVVPGADGDCRIRVGDQMLIWREGEGLVFDFTVEHAAWNDSDGIRVLLMLEFVTPLPWYLAGTNRIAQRAMGWFPTTRDMPNRLRALEPKLMREESDRAEQISTPT